MMIFSRVLNVDMFLFCIAFLLFSACSNTKTLSLVEVAQQKRQIHHLMDEWHLAATKANKDTFFGSMHPDGIYIGTDSSEYWLRDELAEWSDKYFERDTAWAFVPLSRNVYIHADGSLAWFDEILQTWMGACRGSGVVVKGPDQEWKIKHYHLSIAIPNGLVDKYLALLKKGY